MGHGTNAAPVSAARSLSDVRGGPDTTTTASGDGEGSTVAAAATSSLGTRCGVVPGAGPYISHQCDVGSIGLNEWPDASPAIRFVSD
jgi:hypothetical protein